MDQSTPYRSAVVMIGEVPLGGSYPVRVQTMTNTNTLDTKSTVAQCIRIIEAGADFVRVTAQGVREAENLVSIKSELHKAGFKTPLIADIHFNPKAAEIAARIVEKVRINPGNYADKRAIFNQADLTDREYSGELERIRDRLLPLIKICRDNNTAIRIGVNHGSLSDRIMSRFGNTPEGMATSAMEFIRIFREENFHKLVLSMKSSDPGVMIIATRMLVKMMTGEGCAYPLHIGVTEAGEGEDGRIRSASGIGALLLEGIGDTIRVSLSEDPEREIPVAREIVEYICGPEGRIKVPASPLNLKKRKTPYKPEVLALPGKVKTGDRRILHEDGSIFRGKLIDMNRDTLPDTSTIKHSKIFLHSIFSESDPDRLAIHSAILLGRYCIFKHADGICISNKGLIQGDKLKELAFSVLQSTGARITRVVYLSCPTCGRTKFDLQDAVRKVKAATGHLTGLKIAVMGCIVNGPGEMEGADYGFVGTSEGKVNIYRGIDPVLKNIPYELAADQLLKLIEEETI